MNSASAKKRRILLVDDHPVVRSGLAQIIGRSPDLEVADEAGDAEAALLRIAASVPDLVIADISLPTMNGIEMTKIIKERYPKLPVLVVSMHEESLYAERALRAGARGYVTKLEPPDVLLTAAREVLLGEVFISKRTSARLLKTMTENSTGQDAFSNKMNRVSALTDRELEVFEAIGTGMTTREIAERLGRSIKTVETHRTNIISKLGLPGSASLRECAATWISNCRRSEAPAPELTSQPTPSVTPHPTLSTGAWGTINSAVSHASADESVTAGYGRPAKKDYTTW